ncbi:MAG: SIMPL domain-containing protein [Bacteroidota bacterium]
MKKIVIVFLTLFLAVGRQGQAQIKETTVRKIEVAGSSELEITPDEIFVSLTVKEYRQGGKTVSLDELESGLIKALKQLKVPEKQLRVQNVSGYNWDWRKKRADDFLGSKTFLVEVNDLKKMNDLVGLLDPEGLNSVNVQSYSHSEIEDFRKQVKIGAIKVAKSKATYLLQSVGEDLGRILEVQEIEYGYNQPSRAISNVAYTLEAADYHSNVEFKKVKLRSEIRVVFEIK